MSFNPTTGLVYIPAIDMAFRYEHDPNYQAQPGPVWNLGTVGGLAGIQPGATGSLVAWDPVARTPRWTVQHPTSRNSGTLTTAGNLVFQGTAEGRLVAYNASSGAKLWESAPGTPLNAGPVTFLVDGVQHVAIMAGPRGGTRPDAGQSGNGSLLVFKRGGEQAVTSANTTAPVLTSVAVNASAAEIAYGAAAYGAECSQCHGPAAASQNAMPDLRHAQPAVYDQFAQIVLEGARADRGMPSFAGRLSASDVEAIKAYVLTRRAEAAKTPGGG
jgi:quinohemoprotein ethanol dehydrogenase